MKTLKDLKKSTGCIITIIVIAVFLMGVSNVFAQFQADFEGSPRSGDAPLTVTFTDKSEGQVLSWGWSFPGGTPSSASGKGPHTVTYYNAGSYDVTLNIMGSVAQYPPPSDTETKSNYIKVYESEPDMDYGDAPDDGTGRYPTFKANNGACHIINDSIYLGSSVDADDDGQPDDRCEGDDYNDDNDDEDGVVIPLLFAGDSAHIKVIVHGSGYLNGWIDFNQDRDWDDEYEHIIKDTLLSKESSNLGKVTSLNGIEYDLEIYIPGITDIGETFSRFRISTEPELSYEGSAINGEVEDYIVDIYKTGQDSLALVALYNSTDGDNWDNNTNWLLGPLYTWYGITVKYFRVTNITLLDNNLIGTIPPELGNLDKLDTLAMSENQLSGTIPPEIGNMHALKYFWLHNNELSGSIPPELGNLSNLENLTLSWNQLNGSIPPELGNLSKLSYFRVGDNDLTGSIPIELGNLTTLTELDLHKNQLSDFIPSELGNLTNLNFLRLSDNQLTGSIPSELGNLTNLTYLSLCENQLTDSIPPELGNLTNLEILELNDNQLTGSIPSELENLTKMFDLYLDNNQFTGSIPPELGNLSILGDLRLNDNQLTGSIPPELGNLTSLWALRLGNNELTDSIPSELSNLTNLGYLYLNSNKLIGVIPSTLINLSFSQGELDLRWNGLYTDDNTLRTFLNSKQDGGDWESTQTIAPKSISATYESSTSVTISWTPILYTANTGGYKVLYSTNAGGPYTEFDMTVDKTIDSMMVKGLVPDQEYYFMIKTQTDPHSDNNNTVISEPSDIYYYKTRKPDMDYGDAPDDGTGKYPTLKANNGACHIINDSIYLGSSVDAEDDGQPDDRCEGDDYNDDSDDEDGVVIPQLITGNSAHIKVIVHGTGYLNGWIDFNRDRDWEDEGEQVFNAVSLSDGTHNLELNVPVTADAGNTYGRFRFSDESDLTYEGLGSMGEVEDYYLEILAFYQDSLALVALYDSTDGDHWDNNSNWLTGSLDSWYGIRVSSGRVSNIFLNGNNLIGVIPATIGNLTKIQNIDLNTNQLTGPIPPEIGNLTNLEDFWLSSNQLTDSIPAELGNLINLKDLRLDFNQFTGPIPTELGYLVNLKNLILCDNQFTGIIPVELGNLINLERLILSMNQITGTIPIEIINLPNLNYINLGDNLLDGLIPSELANMINLQGLVLGENQFIGPIPPDLGNLTNLTDLSLNYNQLTGSIPIEIGNLTNLVFLLLGNNQLTDTIPSVLGNLTDLEYLTFGNNQLTGSIPAELGNLINLKYLTFDNNQLTGSIPSELGNFTNLENFYLNSNQLTGPIPSNLINLTNLYSAALDLRWNSLYTSDTSLRNFLNSKQIGGDWESTQTIAPENVTCSSVTDTSVTVSWSPITYTDDAGGYKVFYSTDISGPYIEFGMTSDKTIGSLEVTGLNAETRYYCMVKTQTDPHANNSNTVVSESSDIVSTETLAPSDVEPEDNKKIPDSYALYQNHPNPFNLETEIIYDLPKSTYVTLTVYNMLGQPVRTLVDSKIPAGSHKIVWDAQDNTGQVVPSGIYVFILKSEVFTEKRKALLMK